MIPVLTKEHAYKLDKDTIESGHLSQAGLMDNAGKAVAQFFCEKIQNPFSKTVVVVCGKGNNGGDGVIALSYLKKYNVSSKIIFLEENHGHSKLLKKYKIPKTDYSIYNDKIQFDKYDWIIDGIFGIGLSRDLNDKYINIIENININRNIISIDIPSGMFTNNDKSKYFIRSKHVVSFGYPKLGHYLSPLNSLFFSDIGFKSISSKIEIIEQSDISNILKLFKKKNNIHKYSRANTNIVAGSKVYPGAAILAVKAAFKTGSSFISLCIDSNDKDFIDKINLKLDEAIVTGYKSVYSHLMPIPTLFGPGISFPNESCIEKIDFNTSNCHYEKDDFHKQRFIYDAGALYCRWDTYIDKSILTPHFGELKSIFNLQDDVTIDINLFKLIQKKISGKIIILKSFNTFIITRDIVYIMDKGPSILATAGTGDVLSGILVSLLSQGYSRLEASILGTYLHAEAANYYMNNISKDGMTASDLIDCIPHAFNELRNKK